MKFNPSVLSFALVLMAVNVVLVSANASLPDESMLELSADPLIDKVRVNRRTHCGVEVFKLLMLICTNDLKFPVARPNPKDLHSNNDHLLNYEPYKRSSVSLETMQSSIRSSDLLQPQPQFNLKKLDDYGTLQDRIPDVHVHNNPNYHRMKRSLIRDCCHRSCSFKELESMC